MAKIEETNRFGDNQFAGEEFNPSERKAVFRPREALDSFLGFVDPSALTTEHAAVLRELLLNAETRELRIQRHNDLIDPKRVLKAALERVREALPPEEAHAGPLLQFKHWRVDELIRPHTLGFGSTGLYLNRISDFEPGQFQEGLVERFDGLDQRLSDALLRQFGVLEGYPSLGYLLQSQLGGLQPAKIQERRHVYQTPSGATVYIGVGTRRNEGSAAVIPNPAFSSGADLVVAFRTAYNSHLKNKINGASIYEVGLRFYADELRKQGPEGPTLQTVTTVLTTFKESESLTAPQRQLMAIKLQKLTEAYEQIANSKIREMAFSLTGKEQLDHLADNPKIGEPLSMRVKLELLEALGVTTTPEMIQTLAFSQGTNRGNVRSVVLDTYPTFGTKALLEAEYPSGQSKDFDLFFKLT